MSPSAHSPERRGREAAIVAMRYPEGIPTRRLMARITERMTDDQRAKLAADWVHGEVGMREPLERYEWMRGIVAAHEEVAPIPAERPRLSDEARDRIEVECGFNPSTTIAATWGQWWHAQQIMAEYPYVKPEPVEPVAVPRAADLPPVTEAVITPGNTCPDGTIDEVLLWVGDDPMRATVALSKEGAKAKPRARLRKQLLALGADEERAAAATPHAAAPSLVVCPTCGRAAA